MKRNSMKTATFDTNTVDDAESLETARLAGFDVAQTTVTGRELESSGIRSALAQDGPLYEPFVLGESRLGFAVLGSESVADTFERVLRIVSNGSFPARDRRSNLSQGERRQLRDAMILTTHIREGREIFVTNDAKGFIHGGRRELLETEFAIRVMTALEFVKLCQGDDGGERV
jgi:hypothetical protein